MLGSVRMGRMLDWLAAGLMLGTACSFSLGIHALGGEEDRLALYLLAIGVLALKSSADLLRPLRKSP
jgi:hypothetical protein